MAELTRDLRRVVYLGGLGRSGSTLLERLLGELPGACSAGEVVHMWQRGIVEGERCGCGQPFGECEFWCAVGQDAFGGWDAVDVGRIAQLRSEVDRTRYIPLLAASALHASTPRPDRRVHRQLRAGLRVDRQGQRLPDHRGLQQARLAGVLPAPPARPRPAGHPRGARQPGRRLLVDQAGQPAGLGRRDVHDHLHPGQGGRALERAEPGAAAAGQDRARPRSGSVTRTW